MDIKYAEIIKWFRYNHSSQLFRLLDSLSPNQIRCKQWLVDSLDNVQIPRDGDGKFTVEIVGAWYGYPLVQMLMDKYGDQIKRIDLFDTDETATIAAWKYTRIFKHNNVRIFNENYFDHTESRRTHMIINTSCEHMPDMAWVKEFYEEPDRTLLVLQSNNKRDEPDHINCVDSCQELSEQADITELWGGHLALNGALTNKKSEFYNRFMVMGKWYD